MTDQPTAPDGDREPTPPADGSDSSEVTANPEPAQPAVEEAAPDTAVDDETDDSAEKAEPEWWEDPRMPWNHRGGKPGRADIGCFIAISVIGIYGLVLLPFRALLITQPYLYAAVAGSRTAVVTIGAMAAPPSSNPWWPVGLLLAILSIVKFDWIYFWAGRLWGQGLIEMVAGRSKRARRNAERAERLARKYATLAMLVTFLPVPLPASVIYAALGAAGMSWRKFIFLDVLFAVLLQSGYLYLGYRIGAPAVEVVKVYADYALYVTLGILAFMLVSWWWRKRRRGGAAGDVDADSGERGSAS